MSSVSASPFELANDPRGGNGASGTSANVSNADNAPLLFILFSSAMHTEPPDKYSEDDSCPFVSFLDENCPEPKSPNPLSSFASLSMFISLLPLPSKSPKFSLLGSSSPSSTKDPRSSEGVAKSPKPSSFESTCVLSSTAVANSFTLGNVPRGGNGVSSTAPNASNADSLLLLPGAVQSSSAIVAVVDSATEV